MCIFISSMYKESLLFFIWAVAAANGLFSGFGGVVGNLTPRTGSSWPPYPGAGRGYWANRAGYYDGGRSRSDTKDTARKEDFTRKLRYFSKPLHMLINRTNQIVSFDQPTKSDQSVCFF